MLEIKVLEIKVLESKVLEIKVLESKVLESKVLESKVPGIWVAANQLRAPTRPQHREVSGEWLAAGVSRVRRCINTAH
jgi:hypothetical protein